MPPREVIPAPKEMAVVPNGFMGASIYPQALISPENMLVREVKERFPSGVAYQGDRKSLRGKISMDVWTHPFIPISDDNAVQLVLHPERSYERYSKAVGEQEKIKIMEDIGVACITEPHQLIFYMQYFERLRKQKDPAFQNIQMERFVGDVIQSVGFASNKHPEIITNNSDVFTVWLDYMMMNYEAYGISGKNLTPKTPFIDRPSIFNIFDGITRSILALHSSTAEHSDIGHSGLVINETSYQSQEKNLGAVVDFAYALMRGGIMSNNRLTTEFAYKICTNNIFGEVFQDGSLQKSLLLVGEVSLDNETRRKALMLNHMLEMSSRIFNDDQRYLQFRNSERTDVIAQKIHHDSNKLNPNRITLLRDVQTKGRYHSLFIQSDQNDGFYLQTPDEIEEQLLTADYPLLYAFSRLINNNRPPQQYDVMAPITLPTGVFRNVAREIPSDNKAVATRILESSWNTTVDRPRIENHEAIEDALSYLSPKMLTEITNWKTVLSQISNESLPLQLTIGKNNIDILLNSDGHFYTFDGQQLYLPEYAEFQWRRHIIAELRPSAMDNLAFVKTEISQNNLALILKFLTPEFLGTTFIALERDLNSIKEELRYPRRGILEEGITVKIKKGQLPKVIPIDSIKYNQAASEAIVTIGESKFKVNINMTQPPPSITHINGFDIPESTEKVWLEYVVLSPLKAFTCPDVKKIDAGCDDSVLLSEYADDASGNAIRKTSEVLRKNIGHLVQLGRYKGTTLRKYSEEQRRLVSELEYPIPGIKKLDLEEYNNERRRDSEDSYWGYAIYQAESYHRRQKIKHAEVVTPHAFDTLAELMKGENSFIFGSM